MYISKIEIENFRNFRCNEVEFNDGINVIIGHNNAGKSNLIKALALVLNPAVNRRLSINDFNMNSTLDDLTSHSPKVSITITIAKGTTSTEDDLVTVSEWLTVLNRKYEAKLTYQFFLPEKYEKEYLEKINQLLLQYQCTFCAPYTTNYALLISKISNNPIRKIKSEIFRIINNDFLRFYTYKIWGGEVKNKSQADGESLQKFDFQFVDAIRDVERDLISGRNVMLKEVLHFFLDYDIKKLEDTDEERNKRLQKESEDFSKQASELIEVLDRRMRIGKDKILSYANDTGASLKSKPSFEGETSDIEMLGFLKLIVEEKTGFKIPASHNGLGYNNLIYISILLAKMQADADEDFLGSNSKVFPMLVIEEPEAHLHPSMQDKFLKFLRGNIGDDTVRQIFITSHSTHVTSATKLEEIICLHHDTEGSTRVGYLGRLFNESDDDLKSKKYVKRFLDATKSNMLFAEKIIFVEGIAEQLLMSVLAKYLGLSLEDNHVAVINIGGRYFKHFLKLFDEQKNSNYAILKKVACITDRDPVKKIGNNYVACYPFEYKKNNNDYKNHASDLFEIYGEHKNIKFFSQDENRGKTFEYDLVLYNPKCEILVTESMSNQNKIKEMMNLDDSSSLESYLELIGTSAESNKIRDGIRDLGSSWEEDDKIKAVIASRYLNSIGKGENALELAYALEENLNHDSLNEVFTVPVYIQEALKWICQ